MFEIFSWLEGLRLAQAVRATPYVYASLESVHVLAIALLVGPAVCFDLRLLGWGRRLWPVTLAARILLPLSHIGFVLAVCTGGLMFIATATTVSGSGAFPLKFGLIIIAGINIAIFHFGIYRTVESWNRDRFPPWRARAGGAISGLTWAGVIVCGRMLAYS